MPYISHTGKKLGSTYRKKRHYLKTNKQSEIKFYNHEIVVQDSKGISKSFKILKILKSPANNGYISRGIIVKGTHVKTKNGAVVITSKPSRGIIYGKPYSL